MYERYVAIPSGTAPVTASILAASFRSLANELEKHGGSKVIGARQENGY